MSTFARTLRRIQHGQTSPENSVFTPKAIFPFRGSKIVDASSPPPHNHSRLTCDKGWGGAGGGGAFPEKTSRLICHRASASWTSWNLVKVHRLEDFFPPFPKLPIIRRPSFPLQLVINGDQALARCFHKVLLGQQSHQLGCLKFYHQHSSNKCWPERLLLFGNSCSLSL